MYSIFAFFQFSRQLKFFIEHALTWCSCQCELTWLHSCALYILKLKTSNAQVVNVTSMQGSNPSTGGHYSRKLLRLKHPGSACCRNPSLLKLCSTLVSHFRRHFENATCDILLYINVSSMFWALFDYKDVAVSVYPCERKASKLPRLQAPITYYTVLSQSIPNYLYWSVKDILLQTMKWTFDIKVAIDNFLTSTPPLACWCRSHKDIQITSRVPQSLRGHPDCCILAVVDYSQKVVH